MSLYITQNWLELACARFKPRRAHEVVHRFQKGDEFVDVQSKRIVKVDNFAQGVRVVLRYTNKNNKSHGFSRTEYTVQHAQKGASAYDV